jgi:hypothetical protein
MFRKRSRNLFDAVETLIGRNALLEGVIKTDKVMRIDGKIKSDIETLSVFVGQRLRGGWRDKYKGYYCMVCGLVEGNIKPKLLET